MNVGLGSDRDLGCYDATALEAPWFDRLGRYLGLLGTSRAVGGRAARARVRVAQRARRDPRPAALTAAARALGYEAGGCSGWGMQSSSSSATVMRSRFSQVISLVGSLRTLYSRNDCSRLS